MSKKTVAILACAYAAAGFILGRIPLFDYLGYEFSTSLTFLVALCTPIVTPSYLRNGKWSADDNSVQAFFRTLGQSAVVQLALLSVPLFLITLNALVVKNCSYAEGLMFFVLLPCVTVIFCSALMGWCWVIFRRPRLVYFAILAIVLIHPLIVGYITPQIYSYNPIFGYFPGFSYDEVLTISPTLIFFRVVTLIAALFLLSSVAVVLSQRESEQKPFGRIMSFLKTGGLRGAHVLTIVTGVLLIVLWLMRTSLGFESSSRRIQQFLGNKCRTEHFIIYYSARSFSDEEIIQVAKEHEFRFHQVESALQLHYSGTIDSYIYPDAESKRIAIGTGTTNIAKPWRREVHLNKDSWEETLKHELVHVLAGEFGMPVIRAHYHTGLVEGLAMAIDDDYGNRTLHEYAAAMMKFGLIRNPEHLISPLGFALQPSSVSYVLMGSFCRFLLDRFGMIRFKELYGGASAESVYGRSYEQLVNEWQHTLLRVNVPDDWYQHVAFYFNRQSIFARECARAIAKLNQTGWTALSSNASVSAMEVFSRSLHKSWNTEAFAGFIRSAYQATLYDTVVQALNREWSDSVRQASMINQLLIYGDALWQAQDTVSALRAYRRLLAIDLSDAYNDAAALRIEALSQSSIQKALFPFFIGSLDDSSSLALFSNLERSVNGPLLPYLRARILFRHSNYRGAADELDTSHAVFTERELGAARCRLQAEIHFRLNDYQAARRYLWESLNFTAGRAAELRIDDRLERCEWYEAYTPGSR